MARHVISPAEHEHKACWAAKLLNFNSALVSGKGKLQLNELDEWRSIAYENSRLYEEKVKGYHDWMVKQDKKFVEGDQVLLHNVRLRQFPSKLNSRWLGPCPVTHISPLKVAEINHP